MISRSNSTGMTAFNFSRHHGAPGPSTAPFAMAFMIFDTLGNLPSELPPQVSSAISNGNDATDADYYSQPGEH
jgi:hypothetical protein